VESKKWIKTLHKRDRKIPKRAWYKLTSHCTCDDVVHERDIYKE
jgi:hypothetical protein